MTTCIPYVVYALLVLQYPLVWERLWKSVPLWDAFPLIQSGLLGAATLALLLADLPRVIDFCRRCRGAMRLPLWALGLLGIHSLLYFHTGMEAMLTGPARGLLLLLAAVHFRVFARTLPAVLFGLAGLSAVIAVREYFTGGYPYGLTGNWNWSGTLLLVGFPALGVLLHRRIGFIVGWLAAVALLVAAYPGLSKGALLAGCAAPLILLAAGHPRFRRPLFYTAIGVVLVGGIVFHRQLAAFLASDIRLPMWRATLRLSLDHWFTGGGPARFDSEIMPYLGVDYFWSSPVERHLHPHNEILYLWSTWGVAGLLFALAVLAVLWRELKGFVRRPRRWNGFLLYAALVLLIHGMFDLTLNRWPPGLLALLIFGTLWGAAVGSGARPPGGAGWGRLAGVLLLLPALYAGYDAAESAWHFREARLARAAGNVTAWRDSLRQSVAIRPTAENLYAAARCELYDRRDPRAALRYLERIRPETGIENIEHNHNLRGRCLLLLGDDTQAIRYFRKEQRNFPLGIGNAWLLLTASRRAAPESEWRKHEKELRDLLTLRRLKPEVIPYLLRYPDEDIHPIRLPAHFRLPPETAP